MMQGVQMGAQWQPQGVGWGEKWEGDSEGGDLRIPMADSCWCMEETNTVL